MNVQNHAVVCGRRIDFFCHGTEPEWGYADSRTDSFALIYPRNWDRDATYPLDVVFHSAGHDLFSTVRCTMTEGDHDIYHTPDDMFSLILDCRAHEADDWWWGGINVHDEAWDRARAGTEPQPVERRCIATIEWVIENYRIDTDRIYAVGNSMGGTGALGIALCRGDIFAAIKVNVPAGTRHAAERCCLLGEVPEGFSIPDPPVVVDYSSQTDMWSVEHERLYEGMRCRRYAFHGFWGPFGHENNNSIMEKHNDLIHSIPARSLRKCDAYPVFTDASTDDENPWESPDTAPESGQVNGFFHWETLTDTEDELTMRLWLLREGEWKTRVTLPAESEAALLIRRAQHFRLDGGESFTWTLGEQSGVGTADADGHPDLGRVKITQNEQLLTLRRK